MKYFFFFKTTHHFQLKVNLKMLYMGREVSKKLGVSNMSVSGFCVCVCGKGETLSVGTSPSVSCRACGFECVSVRATRV